MFLWRLISHSKEREKAVVLKKWSPEPLMEDVQRRQYRAQTGRRDPVPVLGAGREELVQ